MPRGWPPRSRRRPPDARRQRTPRWCDPTRQELVPASHRGHGMSAAAGRMHAVRSHTVMPSPIGELTLVAEDGTLTGCYMADPPRPVPTTTGSASATTQRSPRRWAS